VRHAMLCFARFGVFRWSTRAAFLLCHDIYFTVYA
jgi:hypothetical protein